MENPEVPPSEIHGEMGKGPHFEYQWPSKHLPAGKAIFCAFLPDPEFAKRAEAEPDRQARAVVGRLWLYLTEATQAGNNKEKASQNKLYTLETNTNPQRPTSTSSFTKKQAPK